MSKFNETILIQVKEDLKLTAHSKNILHKLFKDLKEGLYQLNLKSQKKVSTSRYKYYWGHVLLLASSEFNKRGMFQCGDMETGEAKPCTCDSLHEYFKYEFNPLIIFVDSIAIRIPGSTKNLDNAQFFNEYLEKIICFLAENDVICMTFDEWADYMRCGSTCAEIVNINNETELKY